LTLPRLEAVEANIVKATAWARSKFHGFPDLTYDVVLEFEMAVIVV
jgi:hypothetical protein